MIDEKENDTLKERCKYPYEMPIIPIDKEKFIVRISCEPKITPTDIGTKIVDKTLTLRVEKVNESVISQLRDLMKEKGVNELIAIDESKVLEMVKKAQAFNIIKEKNVAITMVKQTDCVEEYNQFAYGFLPIKEIKSEKYALSPQPLEREEYELVLGVLYGKDRVGN